MGTVSLLVAATKWAKQGAAKKIGCWKRRYTINEFEGNRFQW